MSKKWLIGAIGVAVAAITVLSGCGRMGGETDSSSTTTTTTTTMSSTSTTSSTSAPSTTTTASSEARGLLDEITNVQ